MLPDDYQNECVSKYTTIEYLSSLKFPEIPEQFEDRLFIKWIKKDGFPANSAFSAKTASNGDPMIWIGYITRKKMIFGEEMPFSMLEKDFPLFLELAEEGL